MTHHEDRTFTRRVVEFTANTHRACPSCRAPGQYVADPVWRDRYPAIYDVMRDGDPVGSICPCCGHSRSTKVKRVTRRKEWWVIRLPSWLAQIMRYLKPVKFKGS